MSATRIGILGAGQLGRMLALAGVPLGLTFRLFDPAPNGPAARLGEQISADYEDVNALERFAAELDLVTYEFENVPLAAARALQRSLPVLPPPAALEAAQDRLAEKRFFNQLGIPTAPYADIASLADLHQAVGQLGLPAILKTRRMGYDGKGQVVLREADECQAAWESLGGQPLLLEGMVPFTRELSILAVRGRDGAISCYPLVENTHREGILRRSIAPAPAISPALQAAAEAYASAALAALGYVGVLAIELFEVQRGQPQLIVNEMAPRVHNSGHWTIEGAETSQFENHLRAVCGMPLGSTAMRGYAAMLNLIGSMPDPAALLSVPGAHLHLYEKAPRPGRKIGHVTLRADDLPTLLARVAQIEPLLV